MPATRGDANTRRRASAWLATEPAAPATHRKAALYATCRLPASPSTGLTVACILSLHARRGCIITAVPASWQGKPIGELGQRVSGRRDSSLTRSGTLWRLLAATLQPKSRFATKAAARPVTW